MFDIFNMLKKDEAKAVKQVTRETIIGDILDMDQSTAPYFMEIGMHCLGCPASRGESIEEACEVHGVDCDELVRPGEPVADIGCDHGKLTAVLAASGRYPKVIGADLRPGPLAKAEQTLEYAGCKDRAELRLGDGLSVLSPGEVSTIVLAGVSAQTGEVKTPTFQECLFGLTGQWPEGEGYAAWQKAKLPRLRLGVPDGTELAKEMDELIKGESKA